MAVCCPCPPSSCIFNGFFNCSPRTNALPVRNSLSSLPLISLPIQDSCITIRYGRSRSKSLVRCSSRAEIETRDELTPEVERENNDERDSQADEASPSLTGFEKEVQQAIRKTAGTFAPRSSTRSRNPAVPGTTLFTVFEVQGYLSMALGGLLSFNLIFPSNEPDIWRLMGMWSVWMFTIPSLRARDCSSKEKDALNYLFLGIPLINVLLPIFWKSFPAVWSADVLAFFATYAWKLDWLSMEGKAED